VTALLVLRSSSCQADEDGKNGASLKPKELLADTALLMVAGTQSKANQNLAFDSFDRR